jgi:hypothetical protein
MLTKQKNDFTAYALVSGNRTANIICLTLTKNNRIILSQKKKKKKNTYHN